jgi:hypothetical protein
MLPRAGVILGGVGRNRAKPIVLSNHRILVQPVRDIGFLLIRGQPVSAADRAAIEMTHPGHDLKDLVECEVSIMWTHHAIGAAEHGREQADVRRIDGIRPIVVAKIWPELAFRIFAMAAQAVR